MPRFPFQKTSAILFWVLVCAGLLWIAGSGFLATLDYSLLSERRSPDGKMIIHEFRSHQDGPGHAPYGQILSLSHGDHLKRPDDGYVFFAGYCKQALQYGWIDNRNVSIRCVEPDQANGPRTLATTMYGIRVVYSTRPL